uniref:LysR family transcriptional regulator n=1 Tax=Pararhizobium sp. IMCC3301 TaxID=3067904 RepID=UPI0027421242|nr:LysR family transcriptional regulator [Pararhizobium sp. IMCC3301]
MSNRLGLRQLRAFHAVMVTGSVTVAATRLNLTQPAISKQISALEHAVGLRLFNRRSGRATTPTQQGIEFFRTIEPTIAGLDEIETIARDIGNQARRRLRIAATPPLINSAPLMAAIARFMEREPDARLALEPRHRLDIEDWVAARHIDLALALLPTKHPALKTIPLVETQVVAVMTKGHRLARERVITPELIDGEVLILPSRQPLRTRIDAELKRIGREVSVSIESSSAITCCRMAAAGLGIAVCDPFSATAFPSDDVVTREWTPQVSLTYGALVNKEQEMEPATSALLEAVSAEFARFRGIAAQRPQ